MSAVLVKYAARPLLDLVFGDYITAFSPVSREAALADVATTFNLFLRGMEYLQLQVF
jgi:hypothetical protein